jgi:hypothetical protein
LVDFLLLSLLISLFSFFFLVQERLEAVAKAAGSPTPSNHNDSTSSNLLGASDSWGSGFPSPVGKGEEEEEDYSFDDETGIEVDMEVNDISGDDDGFF